MEYRSCDVFNGEYSLCISNSYAFEDFPKEQFFPFKVLTGASTCGVPLVELADRQGISLTLMLTAVAFKFVMSSYVPPTSYLTYMDKYMLLAFVYLTLTVVEVHTRRIEIYSVEYFVKTRNRTRASQLRVFAVQRRMCLP